MSSGSGWYICTVIFAFKAAHSALLQLAWAHLLSKLLRWGAHLSSDQLLIKSWSNTGNFFSHFKVKETLVKLKKCPLGSVTIWPYWIALYTVAPAIITGSVSFTFQPWSQELLLQYETDLLIFMMLNGNNHSWSDSNVFKLLLHMWTRSDDSSLTLI